MVDKIGAFFGVATCVIFSRFIFFVALVALLAISSLSAADVSLKVDCVVALVGGEVMIDETEGGGLEMEILRALPDRHLRFRCLAWEGDTVFEQRRDLNFPPLEEQLERIGASTAVVQFGEMESLGGDTQLSDFVAAYGTVVDRIVADHKRSVILVGPFAAPAVSDTERQRHEALRIVYTEAIQRLAKKRGLQFVAVDEGLSGSSRNLDNAAEMREAQLVGAARSIAKAVSGKVNLVQNPEVDARWQALQATIQSKNRLWFNYWRPQNWAFLNGDRTAQPSSRDHIDPSKRWFPAEMEQYLPLIEAREREIDVLAAQLARP